MSKQAETVQAAKKFYDIPTAAEFAGYSSRHFRKIIEEDQIPVIEVGTRKYIATEDFEAWKSTRGELRLDAALHQLDLWLKESEARSSIFEAVMVDVDF